MIRALSNLVKNFVYQFKIIRGLNWLLAPLLILSIPLIIFFEEGDLIFRQAWAFKVIETFASLLGILIGANTFSKEWDLQTNDIWLSKVRSRGLVYLFRMILISLYLLLLGFLLLVLIRLFYVEFNLLEGLLVVLPPMFFLAFLGAVVGLLSRNSIIAYLGVSLYWFMEITTKGKISGIFYLFPRGTILCGEACELTATGVDWQVSKLAVVGLGTLIFVSGWILLNRLEFVRRT